VLSSLAREETALRGGLVHALRRLLVDYHPAANALMALLDGTAAAKAHPVQRQRPKKNLNHKQPLYFEQSNKGAFN
jgi:hypothetical protein